MGQNGDLVALYCASHRETISAIPPVSQHGQLGAIPPPPFLSVSPLESMRSGGAIPPPPPQKGYLSDTCAIPYENKANGCDTPLCDIISKGYCAIWGGISHWAAKNGEALGVRFILNIFAIFSQISGRGPLSIFRPVLSSFWLSTHVLLHLYTRPPDSTPQCHFRAASSLLKFSCFRLCGTQKSTEQANREIRPTNSLTKVLTKLHTGVYTKMSPKCPRKLKISV